MPGKKPLKSLPAWNLSELRAQRSKVAGEVSKLAGKLLDKTMPNGGNILELSRTTLSYLKYSPHRIGEAARTVSNAMDEVMAKPVEILARPRRVDLSVGNTVCVRNAARYDLVELLEKAASELPLGYPLLVQPGLTLEDVKTNYEWKGRLLEFYVGAKGSGLYPHYLIVDEKPVEFRPRSTLTLTVVDVFDRT